MMNSRRLRIIKLLESTIIIREWFTYIQLKINAQNTLETTTTATLFFFLYRNGFVCVLFLLLVLLLPGGRGAISIASSPEREKGEEDRRGHRGNFRKRRG